ncbi:MAG: MgtC/SapB family protein [Candidatus Sumerlaeia bacterium]
MSDLHFIPAFLIAALCGAALGLERELQHKPAGLRTNMLIAIGSAMFTYASIVIGGDPGRIAAQIVTGIGFLGAGTIIRDRHEAIHGLTSAATVWVVAALGVFAGSQHYLLAIIGTVLALLILHAMGYVENRIIVRGRIKHQFRILAQNDEWIYQRIQEKFLIERADACGAKISQDKDGNLVVNVSFTGSIAKAQRLLRDLSSMSGVKQVVNRVV